MNVRSDGCEVDEESGGSRMWRRGEGEEREEEEVEQEGVLKVRHIKY